MMKIWPASNRAIVWPAASEAEPQHVHRCAELLNGQLGLGADERISAVGGDDEVGAKRDGSGLRQRAHAHHMTGLLDEAGDFRPHLKAKSGVSRGFSREEVQKIPLRHQ